MQNARCKPHLLVTGGGNAVATFTRLSRRARGLHFEFCILNYLRPSAASVRRQQQQAIVGVQRCARIGHKLIAVQVFGNPGVETARSHQFTQRGEPGRQHGERLAERPGVDLDLRQAGALARDTQEFHVHGVTLVGPMSPSKRKQSRVRATPKGRAVDAQAREDIVALLGDKPRRRDLLIEYLHLVQDRFGCLSATHLVALAAEMKMAMAEVYEVATFYHHFDVVKEGDMRPPAVTVRVCDSIACELAGSHELLETLPATLGT